VIRHAKDDDAAAVAALHVDQIAEGFLSVLGPSFLRRLYRRIGRAPDSFLLVAESEGKVAGFIAGSTDVGGLYRSFLLRDGVVAGASAAGALLAGWRRAFDTLGHARSKSAGVGRGAELLAIAVDPSRQRRGTGAQLVDAFLGEIAAHGCTAAHVVVGADNAAAISLYERAGFVGVDRFELHAGTESLLMQWDRDGPPSPEGVQR
jgi:ribosomal protein S18 acetylase RimI-like enzyme